jgi:hypothetical protein
MVSAKDSPDKQFMLLDGFNNPGFSGGPVLAYEPSDLTKKFYVVAVIQVTWVNLAPTPTA